MSNIEPISKCTITQSAPLDNTKTVVAFYWASLNEYYSYGDSRVITKEMLEKPSFAYAVAGIKLKTLKTTK